MPPSRKASSRRASRRSVQATCKRSPMIVYSIAKQLYICALLLVQRFISSLLVVKSVVVATTAHVRGAEMLGAAGGFWLAAQRCRLHPLPEHRLDGLVARRVDHERLLAGSLEALLAVLVRKAQDAERGAVALLGMGL